MSKPFHHIALEGIDGSGKGTQQHLLAAALRKAGYRNLVETREPSDSPLGKRARDEITDGALPDMAVNVLLAADRIAHVADMWRSAYELDGGNTIFLSDRCVWSAYAYHGIDNPMHTYLSPARTEPDFTVLLDIDPSVALSRITAKRDRFERLERVTAARTTYLQLAQMHAGRFAVVDAGRNQAAIASDVQDIVLKWLSSR